MAFSSLKLGIDIGSTTVKIVVLDDQDTIRYRRYRRHNADVRRGIMEAFAEAADRFGDTPVRACITGSAGMSFAEGLGVPFVQEVIACSRAVETLLPDTDVAIELGGEDAKITFFGDSPDQRMNSSCAGGTGAFIDQMAALLDSSPAGLEQLARKATTLYPIASRCGVFAKTDIQPLLNEGAAKENIAASVFQAVVDQTVGGLAQGRPITGKVAFLGGPLHFLPALRGRFVETLGLERGDALVPEESPIFVAVGAGLLADRQESISLNELLARLAADDFPIVSTIPRLRPLFEDEGELRAFRERHAAATVERADLDGFAGRCYLGIDAGSTTTKLALIDDEGNILHSAYGPNGGSPLNSTVSMLAEVYRRMPAGAVIASAVVTGYGEKLLQAALRIDSGEIETLAHYRCARFFLPEVDFILDIGGQDMKFMRVREGNIEEILLNEACSSGCGSFIETFAASLNTTVEEFAREALLAREPVDLGSRCTVFMNSRVKQAQKEGLSPGDISAGLSYSVVKNALTKVIKIKRPEDYGTHVVLQGGTFRNEAVLRAFELISGCEAVRPDICGIAGAFGAALIARERADAVRDASANAGAVSTILGPEELDGFSSRTDFRRCSLCGNRCRLTVTTFNDGRSFTSGNRCERGAGESRRRSRHVPNLYEYKERRIFSYKPLAKADARAVVGIPRALNMYENYPFWFTFLTELGYRVELSRPSGKSLFKEGLGTIPAESVCYPAKLTHGHIADLIRRKVDIIFYPAVPFERKEDEGANNRYNCPIVAGYPELIRANVDGIAGRGPRSLGVPATAGGEPHSPGERQTPGVAANKGPEYLAPSLSLTDERKLLRRLTSIFSGRGIAVREIRRAFSRAVAERDAVTRDIRAKGEEALEFIKATGGRGIVLAGRPYHVDPEVHHGIPDVITGMGMAVLSEDSIAHLGHVKRPVRVVDQWTYHSRLYRAATAVAGIPGLEMVQLNSFGCGIDAVTAEQVQEILRAGGKIHTLIKIDEGQQLGAARIRLRSLKAVMDERDRAREPSAAGQRRVAGERRVASRDSYVFKRAVFRRTMRKGYTVIAPQMAPRQFRFIEAAFRSGGYDFRILPEVSEGAVDRGLKYVNNDACYPTIITVGQIMDALESGDVNPDRTAVLLTQTGGGCRATNYIALLRKALRDAGMPQVPVVSLSTTGIDRHPGFTLGPRMVHRAFQGLAYGDLLMRVLLRTRPYELTPGSADSLCEEWTERCIQSLSRPRVGDYRRNIAGIVREFDSLRLSDVVKPRIGVVGEILVKYHPQANNHVVDVIESEGGEAVVPDLLDFLLYCAHNAHFRRKYLSGGLSQLLVNRGMIAALELYRRRIKFWLAASNRFEPPARIEDVAARTRPVVSLGIQMGEGWFLTGEMIELIEHGTDGIVCMQPFACLPNQITGKGMIKTLNKHYPRANIAAIDYDPGSSEVNQLNRIKLMMSVARRKVAERRQRRYNEEIA